MGLDATWYRGLDRVVGVVRDEDGEPVGIEGAYVQTYVNPDFPGRNGSVEDRAVYRYAASGDAWHGGYGRYNRWRDELAKMAGYPEHEYEQYGTKTKSYAAAAWHGIVDDSIAFWPLVNFSDCEGVIGPEASARLAKDFAEWDERAQALGAEFYERYREWRHAFEQAAHGGCISFH